MKKFLSSVFLVTGAFFLLFGFYLSYIRYSPKSLAFETTQAETGITHTNLPKILKIDSANIFLPIIPSKITGRKWETTPNGVSFLTQSAIPGNTGNSVFYGHNWSSVLGNLTRVKPGDKVEITMEHGKKYVYEVEYVATVEPTQTSVIEDIGDTRITIYTCTGFLDTKRFVVVAKPMLP